MTPTSATTRQQLLVRLLLLGVLLLTLEGWSHQSAPDAAAAGWQAYSDISCQSTYVQGYSEIAWWGYFPASSGETYSTVWFWGGASWAIAAQGHNSVGGANGVAAVGLQPGRWGTSYYVTASHGSTWFSGFVSTNSSSIYC